MHLFLTLLTLISQGAIVYLLYCLLEEVRCARKSFESLCKPKISARSADTIILSYVQHCSPAYAIWSWRGSSWQLDTGTIPPGYEPGNPPSFQGTYLGQRVKSECVRS